MICPDCRCENAETNEFCDDCGARLAVRPVKPVIARAEADVPVNEESPELAPEIPGEISAPVKSAPSPEIPVKKEPAPEKSSEPVFETPEEKAPAPESEDEIPEEETLEEEIYEEKIPAPVSTGDEETGREIPPLPDTDQDVAGDEETLEGEEVPEGESVPYLLSVNTGRRYLIEEFPALIGRRSPAEGIEPAVDLTGEDPDNYVSRAHGQITMDGEIFLYEDLNSSNGSLINDDFQAAGAPCPIKDGDRLRVGRTDLLFRTQS